jgi:WD40 repeat protein
VAISPDGKTIAVVRPNGRAVRLFADEGGTFRELRPSIDTQSDIWALALGPNGLLAVAGQDQQVRLFDIANRGAPQGRVVSLPSLKPGLSFTRLIRFSPTGTLALAGWGKIELWDPLAESRVAVLPGSEPSNDLAFSRDGRMLAAVGRTGVTSIWTIQDSAARTQLGGFDARTTSLAFGPEGILAGGGWDGKVWTCQKGRCPEALRGSAPPSPNRPASLAFDAVGRLLAHDSQGLHIWPAGPDGVRAEPASQPLPLPRGIFPILPIARTADGRTMALLRGPSIYLWRHDATDRLIPVIPPPEAPSTPAPSTSESAARAPAPGGIPPSRLFRAIQIAPRGDRLYLVDYSYELHAWSLAGSPADDGLHASPVERNLPSVKDISNIALRSDGALLAAADRSGNVALIDTVRRTFRGMIRPLVEESGSVYSALAISPDGSLLAVGSQDGTIALFSVESPARPRLRFRLPGHGSPISSLAFDPTGNRLASASWAEPVVNVWDLDLIGRELKGLDLADDSR